MVNESADSDPDVEITQKRESSQIEEAPIKFATQVPKPKTKVKYMIDPMLIEGFDSPIGMRKRAKLEKEKLSASFKK